MPVAPASTSPRRLVAAAVAALLTPLAGTASAADRTDPIPSSVGPPGGVGFYVNPSAPGLDGVRVQEIVQRSLARWGDVNLGTTSAVPGTIDGVNVIGVGTLPSDVLGVTQMRAPNVATPVAASRSCVPTSRELSDTVTRRHRPVTARLRRDVLAGRRVLRRVVRRTIRVPKYTRTRAAAIAQLCTVTSATSNIGATPEFDVVLAASPSGLAWQLGPALPTIDEYDFETNALHELGHVSGLAHQADGCDPSTPMPVSQANSEYWHAVDEWLRADCPFEIPPAPAPAVRNGSDSTEPLPGPGASALAGIGVRINPRVPAGYDSARFVAVANRAIRRAGGVPVDVTDVPPSSGDGVSVVGFAPLGTNALSSASRVPRSQVVPAYKVSSCRRATKRVRRQVVVRRVVRRRGRLLRRDVVATRTRAVPGFACTTATRPATTTAIAPEVDLRINQQAIAWEFGPRLPTDGTRWDLETALLQDVMTGLPQGSACDTTTPNTSSGASPGDWWRSSTEVQRTRCQQGASNSAASTRRLRAGGGDTTLHLAGGQPADVQALR